MALSLLHFACIILGLAESFGKHKLVHLSSNHSVPNFGVGDKIAALGARARAAESPGASISILALKGLLLKLDRVVSGVKSIKPSIMNKSRELWEDVKEDDQLRLAHFEMTRNTAADLGDVFCADDGMQYMQVQALSLAEKCSCDCVHLDYLLWCADFNRLQAFHGNSISTL